MVWTAKEAKKKLGVLTEKNLAFLAAVEKLEDILTEKSYAVSLRDARKQETKLTEYITKFSCEDIEFELEEIFTEQCSDFEATKKLFIEIKKIKSVHDAISSIKLIADKVCDDLTENSFI